MEKNASAKQDTIRELKALREAYVKNENEKWDISILSNDEFYTDEEPICPEPPEKPVEPRTAPYVAEDFSYWKRQKDNPTPRRSINGEKLHGIGWLIMFPALFMVVIGFIIGLDKGVWILFILGGVVLGVGAFIGYVFEPIFDKVAKASFEKQSRAAYGSYCEKQRQKEKERLNEWNRYNSVVLPPYNEALAEYNAKKAEYDALVKKREAEATKKCEAESDRRMKAAQESFDQARAELSVEISEKYYADLPEIIAILEDGRADTIKEAIAVLLDDKHKEAMLDEQRQLVYEQQAHNRELKRQGQQQEELQMRMQQEQERMYQEQARFQQRQEEESRQRQREEESRLEAEDFEKRQRIKKAREQCFKCGKNQRFPKCPMAGTIETVCPNYEPYHL